MIHIDDNNPIRLGNIDYYYYSWNKDNPPTFFLVHDTNGSHPMVNIGTINIKGTADICNWMRHGIRLELFHDRFLEK